MANCINCNQEVSTAYCPACGQRNPVKKINMVNMWSDFAARIYGFDGMFPRTLRDLTIRPGQVARDYIIGNRVKYYGPVGYFFLTLTVYLLLASMLDIDLVNLMIQSNSPDIVSQGDNVQGSMVKEITSWTLENMRSISFFITLFYVFFTWLLYRKSKFNFVETGVLVFFVTGHTLWLLIIQLFAYWIGGFVLQTSYLMIISILFMIYGFVDFYNHKSKWKIALMGFLVQILSYVALMLVIFSFFTYRMITDKEFLEELKKSNSKAKVEQSPSVK
jgi:hypothetical protein